MESTTQRVQHCRKNRLEGWILLFYAKTERKHPGTRLDVMREIAGFWYDKKAPKSMSIKGECRIYGKAAFSPIYGFEDRFAFMQNGGKNTSSILKSIERVDKNECGITEANLFCFTDSHGNMYYVHGDQCLPDMSRLLLDAKDRKLNGKKHYYLPSEIKNSPNADQYL